MECKFCLKNGIKQNELALNTLKLCQITKYQYLSELVELEKQSHCIEQFAHLLQYSKEPHEGTNRNVFSSILNIFK